MAGGTDSFVQLPLDQTGKKLMMLNPGTGELIQVAVLQDQSDLLRLFQEMRDELREIKNLLATQGGPYAAV